jgi:hypothetical protein
MKSAINFFMAVLSYSDKDNQLFVKTTFSPDGEAEARRSRPFDRVVHEGRDSV